MLSKRSLKRRFCLTLILPILLMLSAVGVAAFYSAHHEIEEVYDAELARTARLMLALMHHEIEEGEVNMQMLHERFGQVGHTYEKHIALRIWGGDELFYSSQSADHFGPQHVIAGFSNKEIDDEHWRFFVLPDTDSKLTVEVAEKYHIRLDIIEKILISMFAPALTLLLVVPVLFWLGLKGGLRPLVRLSQEVGARSPEDLANISEDRTPEEIMPLTQAINSLLTKLQTALTKERRFTDLAAHELKTPLAVIKTLTQSLQRAKNDDERKELLGELNTATDRATNMMTQLLALARLDHESMEREDFSLRDIAQDIIDEMSPLARSKNIALTLEGSNESCMSGSREIVKLALRNLVDNAIKYTPVGGKVKLAVESGDRQVRFAVKDSGPGIPEDKLQLVTERFYRIPGNREAGSGLGLTIVSRIAELLKAELKMENIAGGGFKASVKFNK